MVAKIKERYAASDHETSTAFFVLYFVLANAVAYQYLGVETWPKGSWECSFIYMMALPFFKVV